MPTATILLFGSSSNGDIYRTDPGNVADGATPVELRAITEVWAPNGWLQNALYRTATVVVSSNVGATIRLTPILEGQPLDGTNSQPDARVTFTVPTPAAGERVVVRTPLGLSRPVTLAGGSVAKVGIRGSWIQMLVESIGAVTLPSGELNADFRVDAISVEVEPLGQTQQVANA